MTFSTLFVLSLLFLFGTFLLTATGSALRSLYMKGEKNYINRTNRFFYKKIHLYFFPKQGLDGILYAVTGAQNAIRLLFAFFAILFLYKSGISNFWLAAGIIGLLFASFLIGDYLPRIIGAKFPENSLRHLSFYSSFFLLLAFPLTCLFLRITKTADLDHLQEPDTKAKLELIEIVQRAKFSEQLDENEKKLIASLLSFCEHLTREVMVPRVDVFSLEAKTPIKEAARLLKEEGYSRVPVFEENVDKITGILMYKDILSKYMEFEKKGDPALLEAPISSIQIAPLYTPETKKISDLLQEFKRKQVHIAIVVDEYGGTEGIITIEDILEDIVGEIADEYDVEEDLFKEQTDGSWIVDTRMSLIDTEQQLGIKIPQEGDYDTIGGYIYHCAGEIPAAGFTIKSDAFEITVVKTSDRAVERVRLKPKFKGALKENEQTRASEDHGP